MKVIIPKALLIVAKEYSKFKTPKKRTAGFQEQDGQQRGIGDVLDTVGSLMLTHYLVGNNIPCKYQLSLLQGDTYDIEINTSVNMTVNVKTSAWQPYNDEFNSYHIAIKKSEFHKMNDLFIQVMVHLEPSNEEPHVHFCGWILNSDLNYPLDKNPYFGTIPQTGGSEGLWIPSKVLKPFKDLITGIK